MLITQDTGLNLDLYLPDLKVAVECDEEGHSHIPEWKEEARQKEIEERLSCKFVRFNPHEKGFNIGSVINKLLNELAERNELG